MSLTNYIFLAPLNSSLQRRKTQCIQLGLTGTGVDNPSEIRLFQSLPAFSRISRGVTVYNARELANKH